MRKLYWSAWLSINQLAIFSRDFFINNWTIGVDHKQYLEGEQAFSFNLVFIRSYACLLMKINMLIFLLFHFQIPLYISISTTHNLYVQYYHFLSIRYFYAHTLVSQWEWICSFFTFYFFIWLLKKVIYVYFHYS